MYLLIIDALRNLSPKNTRKRIYILTVTVFLRSFQIKFPLLPAIVQELDFVRFSL